VIEEDKSSGQRVLRFVRGPVFANVILADEINRTPPKTQAALLEAMQEHQVTAAESSTAAAAVLRAGDAEPDRAGRNVSASRGAARPIHVQHQRRLPERGRGIPDRRLTTTGREVNLSHVLSGEEVMQLQDVVRKVPVADHVIRYALQFRA
jgi:MoxR-like ATPase